VLDKIALPADDGELQIVVNRMNPACDMQRAARAMLRAVAEPASMLEQWLQPMQPCRKRSRAAAGSSTMRCIRRRRTT